MMLFTLLNPSEIFLVSRIFVEMDITLKIWIMVVMNTFSLLQLFLEKKHVLEKLTSYSCRLYQTIIKPIESYAVMSQKFYDLKFFMIWHERLGHSRLSMMCRIINNSFERPLKNQKILMPNNYNCVVCSQGKLITRPSFTKAESKSPAFPEQHI